MNINNNKNNCYGCGECLAVCPYNAIDNQYNNEGFLVPNIDSLKCVECGLCFSKCPLNNNVRLNKILYSYVAQTKDNVALLRSASGGVFWEFAKNIINRGGIVVGCAIGDDSLPEHIVVDTINELCKLQGSKYVQSNIPLSIYKRIYLELETGNEVLFSGTPCQVAGIYSYLNKEYDNFYTIDVICHGVASRGVFKDYLTDLEIKWNEKIEKICFRSREVGKHPNNHSICFETQKQRYCVHALKDPFGSSFYHNRILRESCYTCKYASDRRVSDITLGDFNNANTLKEKLLSDDGYNIMLINSIKGEWLFESFKDMFAYTLAPANYTQMNLQKPTLRPRQRNVLKRVGCYDKKNNSDLKHIVKITFGDILKEKIPQKVKDKLKGIK